MLIIELCWWFISAWFTWYGWRTLIETKESSDLGQMYLAVVFAAVAGLVHYARQGGTIL